MIKKILLSNGLVSETAIGIEFTIIEKITKNEKLENDELSIIDVYYSDNGEVLIHRNFMFLKSTQKEYSLLKKYEIKTDEEEKESMQNGSFLNIITSKVSNVELEKIQNYKYFENVKETWSEFAIPFGYL